MTLSRRQRRQRVKATKRMSRRASESSSDVKKKESLQKDKSKEERASTRIASNYEPLESVLVQLPPRDIFVFQSVNSAWHDLIKRSHNVQRQMGLKTQRPAVDISRPVQPDYSPYLPYYAPLPLGVKFTPALHVQHITWLQTPTIRPGQPVSASILAMHIQLAPDDDDAHLRVWIRLLFDDTVQKGDSWRSIQIVDPPISHITPDTDVPSHVDGMTIEWEDGLTLGTVEQAREIFVQQVWEEEGTRIAKNDVYAAIEIEPDDVDACEHVAEQHFADETCLWHDVMHDCPPDHETARFYRDFIDREKMEEMFEPIIWFQVAR